MRDLFKSLIICYIIFAGFTPYLNVIASVDQVEYSKENSFYIDDITPPQLDVNSISVVQSQIEVKLSLKVTDDLSGVDQVLVTYKIPESSYAYRTVTMRYNSSTKKYESTILIRDEVALKSGIWKISWINVLDKAGNSHRVSNIETDPYEGIDLNRGNFTVLNLKECWLKEGNTWYYVDSRGAMEIGWEEINGAWYFFNWFGKMQTGWHKYGDEWYFLKSSGARTTGWERVSGTWYYFNTLGKMQTGWLKEGNTWYYLKSSGGMATGWEKVGGTWYYFNTSGKMKTGWLKEGNTWYYLKSSGGMATGWERVSGTWYYFNPLGKMQTGWLKEGDNWYYLKSNGEMATSGVIDGWKITSNGSAYKL